MKIQIENVPDSWDDLNKFLEYAVKCYTLYELKLMQKPKPIGGSLLIGFGSSHCWVSRKSDNTRILLITNKKKEYKMKNVLKPGNIVVGNLGSSFIVKGTSDETLFDLELVDQPEQKIRFDQTNGNAYFIEPDGTESGYENVIPA